jgi:hypothetical protein
MVGYVALPAFRAPAPLDFSGLNEGLDVLGKSIERNRLLEEQKEIGAALRSGGQGATSSSAPQYGATAQPNRLLSSTSTPAQYSARGVTDRIVGAESGGNPNATNPRSSATGSGQFINSTWLDQIKRNRPDLAAGKTDAQILAMRTDDKLSREITGQYANENSQALRSAGFDPTPGNQYLSHFAGPGGARAVLSADPSTPVRSVLGERVVQANPFLANMTAGDLITWANGKMGGPSAPASVPQPTGPNFASAADVAFGQGRVDTGLSLLEAGRERENQSYARTRQERLDARQEGIDAQSSEARDIQIRQGRQELEQQAQVKLAAVAQRVSEMPEDQARTMWPRVLAVNPKIASTLQQYGVDPNDYKAGTALIIAEARGLSPAKPTVHEVSGRLVQAQPDGTFKEVYQAPPKAKNLTVQEQKEVFEADEGVQAATNVVGALQKALALNEQAYSGPLAQTRGYTTSLFGSEGGAATEELQNVVLQQVLDNLKATFGAAPTEGERQILVDIQGSVNKAPEVRRRIFENAIAAAERRRTFNSTKANAIRGGEYFQPGYQPSTAPNASPAQQSAAPQSGPVRVDTPEQYQALPRGAQYIAPDGSIRTKQ